MPCRGGHAPGPWSSPRLHGAPMTSARSAGSIQSSMYQTTDKKKTKAAPRTPLAAVIGVQHAERVLERRNEQQSPHDGGHCPHHVRLVGRAGRKRGVQHVEWGGQEVAWGGREGRGRWAGGRTVAGGRRRAVAGGRRRAGQGGPRHAPDATGCRPLAHQRQLPRHYRPGPVWRRRRPRAWPGEGAGRGVCGVAGHDQARQGTAGGWCPPRAAQSPPRLPPHALPLAWLGTSPQLAPTPTPPHPSRSPHPPAAPCSPRPPNGTRASAARPGATPPDCPRAAR